MTIVQRSCQAQAPSPAGAQSRAWMGGLAALCAVLCALVYWFHASQQQTLRQAVTRTNRIHHARIDLSQGFLHIGGEPVSAFSEERGRALLEQSLDSFAQSLADLDPLPLDSTEELRESVDSFRQQLSERSKQGQQANPASLRAAYHRLEKQADRIDALADFHLNKLSDQLETRFTLVFSGAIASVGILGAVVLLGARTQHRSRESLRQSEARFAQITEQCGEIIWEMDADGLFTYVSKACTTLLGYEIDEVVGKLHFHDLHPLDGREEFRNRAFMTFARKGVFVDLLNPIVAKDGRILQVLTNGIPVLNDDGTLRGYRGSDRDVTEIRRAESEKAEMENWLCEVQRLDAIGRVSGQLAHDFNNLLTVINGHAELALSMLDDAHPAKSAVLPVLEAGNQASAITKSLLTFSRALPLQKQRINLCEMLDELQPLLRHSLPARIELSINAPAGSPCWAVADKTQLPQAILSLAINARDAMPEGGTLKIDVSQSIQPTGPYVTISVSDTGTGMPPEVRARLFEPFFTTKPKGTSTGLGLSAVHGLVTSLGGHIDVESEVGVGTTFTLSLPTASDNGLPCGRAAQQTLLLIEEDSFLRPLLVQGLKGAGFKVVAATTLADANQQLAAAPTPIDLIVLDTDASTSLTTLRSVREVYPNVPALVLSGTPEEADDEDRALMLSKPFKISEMASLASKLIAESAQDA